MESHGCWATSGSRFSHAESSCEPLLRQLLFQDSPACALVYIALMHILQPLYTPIKKSRNVLVHGVYCGFLSPEYCIFLVSKQESHDKGYTVVDSFSDCCRRLSHISRLGRWTTKMSQVASWLTCKDSCTTCWTSRKRCMAEALGRYDIRS